LNSMKTNQTMKLLLQLAEGGMLIALRQALRCKPGSQ
jgi:hypothetical protein